MRYFTGFLIVLTGVFLFLIPVSGSIYTWKTDPRTEIQNISTGIGITTGNCTLLKPIYDNDIQTLVFISDLTSDVPVYSSYNATTQVLAFDGLTANATRELNISYDISAFNEPAAFEVFADIAAYLCYILFVLFICGGVVYAFLPMIRNMNS